MKILDRYIISSYLKTFISVFLILILVFILQTIWLYIKELAGKDLDMVIVVKFIFYFLPKLIPLVLPLTILLASIMVFGSFAENYEFAAMKSTGISLQRAMSGLSVFIVFLGITIFFFSNNVIPWAEYNSYNLRRNIAKLKPAMLLAEGQFNPVENYNIFFAKKTGDRGQYLNDVLIHIKGSDGRSNTTIIKSKQGELVGKESSNVLKLILEDGNYYTDVIPKKRNQRKKVPFAKSKFDKYTINIDLSTLNDVNIDDKSYSDRYNMLNMKGLNRAIDSLSKKRTKAYTAFSKSLLQRSNFNRIALKPVTKPKKNKPIKPEIAPAHDSLYTGSLLNFFDLKAKNQVLKIALNSVSTTNQVIASKEVSFKRSNETYKRHIISFHEKLALGFACVILFFVGAPLGALIRKGGIGLPMVVAMLLFLTYHFIGVFATSSAKNGSFNPILGAWFSTIIMLPLGIFLTIRATADRGLFEVDNLLDPLKKLFKTKKNNALYNDLEAYTDSDLKAILRTETSNYDYDKDQVYGALTVLNAKGVSCETLRSENIPIPPAFDTTQALAKNYHKQSETALKPCLAAIALFILHLVFANNRLPTLATICLSISIAASVVFLFFYIKSIFSLGILKKHLNKKRPSILFIAIGIPLFPLVHFLRKIEVNEFVKTNFNLVN